MEELLEILEELHDDVDYSTFTRAYTHIYNHIKYNAGVLFANNCVKKNTALSKNNDFLP